MGVDGAAGAAAAEAAPTANDDRRGACAVKNVLGSATMSKSDLTPRQFAAALRDYARLIRRGVQDAGVPDALEEAADLIERLAPAGGEGGTESST
jgi:hypothetical protein